MKVSLLILCTSMFFGVFAQVNQLDSLGRKQGLWTRNWKYSNTTEYEGRFIDGIPIGQFRYYYPEGQVRGIIEHVNARAAYVTFYYENAEVMSEGFYKDQLRDSLWINYDRTGLTLSAERFKEGKLEGKRVVFYLRNQLERGDLRVLSETNYKDSLKNGPFKLFFSSGAIQETGQYLNDLKPGIWKEYNAEGLLDSERSFELGKLHGWVNIFDETGTVVDRSLYRNGQRLNKKQTQRLLESSKRKGINLNH